MSRPLHIACLQTRPMPSIASAIDETMPMAEAAVRAGADMIFLPEYCGGLRTEGGMIRPPAAPESDHAFLSALRDFAARRRVWVCLGSIAIAQGGDRISNRGYMLNDDGKIAGRYDKIHLFDADLDEDARYRESETVEPGSQAVVHETPFGRVGHTICYDLRFPGLFRSLAQSGAEMICCPAAFTKTTGEAHWHVLNRARAIENTCFVISPCAVGPVSGGGESFGHSLVVSPWGEVLSDGGKLPGVIHAQIDLDLVSETAARIPSLGNSRPFDVCTSTQRSVA